MSADQGSGAGAIPRWLTGIVLASIVATLAVVVPAQVRAAHAPAPTNLCVCFRLSPTAPKLTWQDTASSSTIQGYILQRSKTSDFTSNVIEIRISRSTFDFIDETTEFGTTFHYRVRSYAGADYSGWSNPVSASNGSGTPPASRPTRPDNLSLTSENGGLRVNWSNPATNETGIWVQRSGDNGATWEYRASLSLNSTTYFDNDVPAGAPMYRVAAFNSAGAQYSYAVQYVNQSAPGVPTLGGIPQPSVPQVSVPGVPTIGPLPTINPTVPGVSVPPGVIPSNPTAIASPWLNLIPSNPTAIASPWLNLIPSNPATLVPSLPTIRDPMTYRFWAGIRLGTGSQPFGLWVLPATCFGFGCPQPHNATPRLTCTVIVFGILDFCYLADVLM